MHWFAWIESTGIVVDAFDGDLNLYTSDDVGEALSQLALRLTLFEDD